MKLRKLVSLFVAVICTLVICVPVFAADVDLPLEFNIAGGVADSQKGWLTNGVDNVTVPLTAEQVASAKYLVLECGAAPTGDITFIWQGDGDGWAWNQTEPAVLDGSSTDTTIVIDLAKSAIHYDKFKASTQFKFYIAYWNDTIADLQIKRAYLTTTAPKAGGAAAATGSAAASGANPATGESVIIYISAIMLILASGCAFFFYRKTKED